MLKRMMGIAAIGAAASGTAIAEDLREETGLELLSATLGEVPVMVFVGLKGTAAAVELPPSGARVVTGLAAGALLSDLREAADAANDDVAENLRVDRVTVRDTGALIETLAVLSDAQKSRLRSALAL